MAQLPAVGFGLTWVLPEGTDLISKSLAPSFLFVDCDRFMGSNVRQRFDKRHIAAFVSIPGPLSILAKKYGFLAIQHKVGTPELFSLIAAAADQVSAVIRSVVQEGADAIVLCDDLCGDACPLPDPLFISERLIPFYRRFAQEASRLDVPIVFRSTGDIREYYPALAESGYAAVHIAHPQREQVEALFAAARTDGLTPMGGIPGVGMLDYGVAATADFTLGLLDGGPALICDDGSLQGAEQIACATQVLARVRAGAYSEDSVEA